MSRKKGGLVNCNGDGAEEMWNVYILWLPYIKYSNLSWNWFFISFYAATKGRLLPPFIISHLSASRECLYLEAAFELWMLRKFIHCYFLINLSAAVVWQSTFHHLLLHADDDDYNVLRHFIDYVSVFWCLQRAPFPSSNFVWHIDSYYALGCRSINQFEIGLNNVFRPQKTFHTFYA